MKPAQDRIRTAVAASLPPGYGAITRWSRPRQGDWSWMFEAETGGAAPATFVVKVPRWEEAPDLGAALNAGPQQDTEEEYRALESIAAAVAAAGDPGLTAVVPVAYVREVNAVVTERLRAVPLHERLRRTRAADAAALFRRVGRWLRVFHATSDPQLIPFEAEEFEQLADAGRRGALGDAIAAVAAAARVRSGRPVSVGVLHGDFSLRNVLVTIDDRVAVIDPNRYRGRIAGDASHLLTEVRLGRRQLITSGAFRARSRVEQWAAAIIDGYPEIDGGALAFERAVAAVKRWVEVEEPTKGIARLALLPARRLLKSEVGALLRQI
ncbi:MAG: phosphotransferase [Acidimicrobiia bacterium]